MTICDVCKDLNKSTKQVTIIFPNGKENNIDQCENCMNYADVNSLIIGIKEIRKHENHNHS